eukprot:6164864-Pleurochrysis_carterae.AAC.1
MRLARRSGASGRAEEAMRRWKRAFDMGNLRRGRRASCPWRTTNCCCSPSSTARRRCSALTILGSGILEPPGHTQKLGERHPIPTPRRLVFLECVRVVSARLKRHKAAVKLLVRACRISRQAACSANWGKCSHALNDGTTVGVKPYAKAKGEGRGAGSRNTASGRARAGCRGI